MVRGLGSGLGLGTMRSAKNPIFEWQTEVQRRSTKHAYGAIVTWSHLHTSCGGEESAHMPQIPIYYFIYNIYNIYIWTTDERKERKDGKFK